MPKASYTPNMYSSFHCFSASSPVHSPRRIQNDLINYKSNLCHSVLKDLSSVTLRMEFELLIVTGKALGDVTLTASLFSALLLPL